MPKGQRIGAHVSAAGGAENAPENAHALDLECFQFFSRSPRGGAAPKITAEKAKAFRAACKKYGFESYIHTPYYINFASTKKGLAAAAPRIVREELERASLLGVTYVMTHLGSAKDWPGAEGGNTPNAALRQTVQGLSSIFKGKKPLSARLLLEISAGAGAVVGDQFEELAYILKHLGRTDVHICLDTCHLFASGYDVRTTGALNETMKNFRTTVGLPHLKLVHANDSKTELGAHKDRHEHIGRGKIGAEGFQAILAHPDFKRVNFILETKHDNFLSDDIELLKKYRQK